MSEAPARPAPAPAPDTTPIVVGVRSHPLRDLYHALLRMPWPAMLALIAATVLLLNTLFALVYLAIGGIANAEPGSFSDAFFFSVQTFATIGYGAMYPREPLTHWVVVIESVVSLVATAITTGLVFSKFSVASARLVFSRVAVIGPMNGVPTLMLRIGNDRGDRVFDAVVRIAMVRTERTHEGSIFYRMIDLKLARDRAPVLARSFVLMHVIDEESPLAGQTAQSLAACEAELMVSVGGIDETTLQPVHATYTYVDSHVLFDHRFADVLSENEHGRLVLDVRKFHDVIPLG